MSKIFIPFFALASSLLITTHAYSADSGSSSLALSGTSAPVCYLPDPTVTSKTNTSISNKSITVDNLINQQDATVLAWDATMTFPHVMCNYTASISLQSQNGGMKPVSAIAATVGADFLKQVNYTVTARWGSAPPLTLSTATSGTTAVQQSSSAPNLADLIVSISTPASTAPLVAGDFRDNLIVKVGPSF